MKSKKTESDLCPKEELKIMSVAVWFGSDVVGTS